MDLTPPSLTRSPSTPSNTYCPSERSLDYPSPGLVEQQYKLSSIYGDQTCSMNPPMDSETSSLPPLDSMGHSDWNSTTVIHPASSASPMPSILSDGYDTFSSYPYSHDTYHSTHVHSLSTSTPPPTSMSRSPIPASSRAPYSYTSAGSLSSRVKMEASEYGQGVEVSHYPSPRSVHASYPPDNGGYTSTSGYLSDGGSSGWHKSDYGDPGAQDQFYPAPPSTSSAASFLQDSRRAAASYRVARAPRRPHRKLTTKEEANFQCEVKGCGKLFSRSYNFKAHMETHDEKREYPFPCTVGDCNKKFVRKTDLQRHHQSVHMRERNHKCDYCGRLFARKDTLRRHMEDGCSKRFDIGTLDLRADGYDMGRAPPPPMGHHFGGPGGGLPPMAAIPPLSSSGLLGTMPPSLRSGRDHLMTGEPHHGWGR